MEQLREIEGRFCPDAEVQTCALARQVVGAEGRRIDSPFHAAWATCFAYMWRRWGPPLRGHDDYKEVAKYYFDTASPDVVLSVTITAGGCWFKYQLAEGLYERLHQPRYEWLDRMETWCDREGRDCWDEDTIAEAVKEIGELEERTDPAVLEEVRQVLAKAIRELLRPVPVLDGAINALGVVPDECRRPDEEAAPSRYAGLGWIKGVEAMDALLDETEKGDQG